MKKTILVSLFATLISVFTATAQENTYSIIIKMQNGTVLTIGPNEADSIFFDEGTLTVTGQSITDIMKRIDKDSLLMDGFYQATNMNMNVLQQQVSTIADVCSELQNRINILDAIQKQIYNFSSELDEFQYEIFSLKNENAMLNAYINDLKAISNAQESKITALTSENAAIVAELKKLQDIVEELRNR
ncbi:MAG: hypothetical protein IKH32_00345 [Prevotella sp.]|nr:hypothetical protein [Prevotella sp.]